MLPDQLKNQLHTHLMIENIHGMWLVLFSISILILDFPKLILKGFLFQVFYPWKVFYSFHGYHEYNQMARH